MRRGLKLSWKAAQATSTSSAGDSVGASDSVQGMAALISSRLVGENRITGLAGRQELEDVQKGWNLPGAASVTTESSLEAGLMQQIRTGCQPGPNLDIRQVDPMLMGGGLPLSEPPPTDAKAMLARRPEIQAVHEVLGTGTFGEVIRCTMKDSQLQVAVKVLHKGSVKSQERETELSAQLNHTNLIRCHCVLEGPPDALVLDLCSGGTLSDLLHGPASQHGGLAGLGWKPRAGAMVDIISAVEYLHEKRIVHRDIKSANAFLSTPVSLPVEQLPPVKLGDLGLARAIATRMTQCTGTWRYMAPEVLETNEYAESADVFSCGILLHEVMSGKVPFSEWETVRVAIAIGTGHRPDPKDIDAPGPIKDALAVTLQACWAEEPAERPSAAYLGKCLQPLVARS
mmetsp:Transcript_105222/g.280110  ORF Transcript_105222/g.280110 Transcript_105222/m.280110 type:complete len:399 (-) Transcript_105222:140-1336(-)